MSGSAKARRPGRRRAKNREKAPVDQARVTEICVACGMAECPAHAIPGKGLHPMAIRKGCSAYPPAGLWLVARSWAAVPYPCRCAERPWVCRKGPQPGAHPGYYCPCMGRSFVAWRDTGAPEPGLPPTCCSYVFR